MIERLGQSLFLPTVLFGFAYFGAANVSQLPSDAIILLGYLPYASLLLVALIASAFNRGRSLIAATFGLLLLSANQYQSNIAFVHALGLLLIPINLAILAFLPERGTLTSSGILRITLVLGQLGGAIFLADRYGSLIEPWLFFELMSFWPHWLNASQPAVIVALIAVAVTLGASCFSQSPVTQSLFAANAGIALVLIFSLPATSGQAFLTAIALALAIGLMRDYYNMAYRDELTSLPQRRALNESLSALSGRYCMSMLDVDHFKKFNDTHGHDVGDQVLQMVASQIRKVQGGGKAYRYGGEEFTVVFAGKQIDDASYFLEQVRKNIEGYEMVIREQERIEEDTTAQKDRKKGSFRKAGKKVSVTISIGVAEKSKGENPDEVLKRADEALYRAKKGGRNRLAT
ncbi:MAG: diguanylate cyclase (GGDEF)-like protein [Candidatus Azotimanducaceae bacterium]|jgi:diguanylate cyclase (GGDEF)-like protein